MTSTLPLVAQTPEQMRVGASWIAIGDWADAAVEHFGGAKVLTPARTYSAEDTRAFATLFSKPRSSRKGWKRYAPETAITFAKDVRNMLRSRTGDALPSTDLAGACVPFVWQHHSMFQRRGLDLAARLQVPSVIYLEALQVQEAKVWGHRRPGWATALEHLGEARTLRQANLVTCVSDELKPAIERLGVHPDRVLATPNKASVKRFQSVDIAVARDKFGAGDEIRIGWIGSFRPFHGLDALVDAFAALRRDGQREVKLILAGDGPERLRLMSKVSEGVSHCDIEFCGPLSYDQVPVFLRSLDIGVVSAAPGQQFHYSPLKLEELMAAHVATIAPGAGQIARQLKNLEQAVLYDPDSHTSLVDAMQQLIDDENLRAAVAKNGLEHVRQDGGIVGQLRAVIERLDDLGTPISSAQN